MVSFIIFSFIISLTATGEKWQSKTGSFSERKQEPPSDFIFPLGVVSFYFTWSLLPHPLPQEAERGSRIKKTKNENRLNHWMRAYKIGQRRYIRAYTLTHIPFSLSPFPFLFLSRLPRDVENARLFLYSHWMKWNF